MVNYIFSQDTSYNPESWELYCPACGYSLDLSYIHSMPDGEQEAGGPFKDADPDSLNGVTVPYTCPGCGETGELIRFYAAHYQFGILREDFPGEIESNDF